MDIYGPDYIPRSAMAIFAHPDDAEFMVAGTIARWAREGCRVTLVLITSGNAGTHESRYTRATLARTREREQRDAAKLLGVEKVVFLRHDDGTVVPDLGLRRELVREIRKGRPEVVVCGDPQSWFHDDRYINHPDHRAAAVAALEATFPCAEMELLWPGEGPAHKVSAVYIGPTSEPNVWIDIGGTIGLKISALRAHASQLNGWDPSSRIRDWAQREAGKAPRGGIDRERVRSARTPRLRYAESFRVMKLHAQEASSETAKAS